MKTNNINRISLTAFIFFALQYTLYKVANMQPDPSENPLRWIIAFEFEFLMVLTFSIGIWVPLSLWLEARSGRSNSAWFYGIILFLLTTTGFIFFSYARMSQAGKIGGGSSSDAAISEKAANAVANHVQFIKAEMQLQKEEEVLRIAMKFQNSSQKEITEMDYTFVALENGRIFYRINIRDSFLIQAGKIGDGVLTWDRSKFKDPALFDRLRSTFKAKTLRVFAKPSRVVFMDGTSLQD